MRIAATAWKLRPLRGDSGYFGHFHDLLSAAHDEGAEVVVFPELHVLELLPLGGPLREEDGPRYLAQYAQPVEDWVARMASNSGLTIVSGSHFREEDGVIKNVGVIARPDQPLVRYEKNNLTQYEHLNWNLAHGKGLRVTPEGLGVTICYDSEFPEAGRNLAEAGAWVHCVPAWTETVRGFQRVRWSCLARAVENQLYVVHSSLLGDLGREPAPESYGSSAIIAPSAEPFPPEAVLRETPLNEEGVVVADLDFQRLAECRALAEVRNWLDRRSGDWTVLPTDPVPAEPGP